MLKLSVLLAATLLAVGAPRENASATDLYLFPIGVVAGMATMVARALSETLTRAPDDGRLVAGAVAIAVLLFPAIGGLAARGRNGLARLLLIVALCFAYIDFILRSPSPCLPAIWRCPSRSRTCGGQRSN